MTAPIVSLRHLKPIASPECAGPSEYCFPPNLVHERMVPDIRIPEADTAFLKIIAVRLPEFSIWSRLSGTIAVYCKPSAPVRQNSFRNSIVGNEFREQAISLPCLFMFRITHSRLDRVCNETDSLIEHCHPAQTSSDLEWGDCSFKASRCTDRGMCPMIGVKGGKPACGTAASHPQHIAEAASRSPQSSFRTPQLQKNLIKQTGY